MKVIIFDDSTMGSKEKELDLSSKIKDLEQRMKTNNISNAAAARQSPPHSLGLSKPKRPGNILTLD